MGTRGPVPKRESQRRRANQGDPVEHVVVVGEVEVPEPDDDWHDLARDLYASLPKSAQSKFYEPSDWQMARIGCFLLSAELGRDRPRAVMVQTVLGLLSNLLVTEGERRRVRLEIERRTTEEGEASENVSFIDEARQRLKSG